MKGIRFVKDPQSGETIEAIIDLRVQKALFEGFFKAYLENMAAEKQAEIAATDVQEASKESTSTDREKKIQELLKAARSYLGTIHKIGGTSPTGIDCSGLSTMAYKEIGITLPRSSRDQILVGTPVELADIQAGDLAFFATGSDPNRISHVGIISRGGTMDEMEMIHASTSRGVVEEQLFRFDYYKKAFRAARRII